MHTRESYISSIKSFSITIRRRFRNIYICLSGGREGRGFKSRLLHHSDKIRLQKSTDLWGLLFADNVLKLAELRDSLWVPSGFSREGPGVPANAVFRPPWAIFLRFPEASPGRYEHNSGMGFTSGQTQHLLVRTILRRKPHLATENGRTPCYYTGIR
jgi:hypothetical protein